MKIEGGTISEQDLSAIREYMVETKWQSSDDAIIDNMVKKAMDSPPTSFRFWHGENNRTKAIANILFDENGNLKPEFGFDITQDVNGRILDVSIVPKRSKDR